MNGSCSITKWYGLKSAWKSHSYTEYTLGLKRCSLPHPRRDWSTKHPKVIEYKIGNQRWHLCQYGMIWYGALYTIPSLGLASCPLVTLSQRWSNIKIRDKIWMGLEPLSATWYGRMHGVNAPSLDAISASLYYLGRDWLIITSPQVFASS